MLINEQDNNKSSNKTITINKEIENNNFIQEKLTNKEFTENIHKNSEIKEWFQLETFDKVNEMNSELIKVINAKHDSPQKYYNFKEDIEESKNKIYFKVNTSISFTNNNNNRPSIQYCKTEEKEETKSNKNYIFHTQNKNNCLNNTNHSITGHHDHSLTYEREPKKKLSYQIINRKRNISNNFIKERPKKLKKDDVEDTIEKLREIKEFEGNKNFKIGPKIKFKYHTEEEKKNKPQKTKIEPSITGYDGEWIQFDKEKTQLPMHFVDLEIKVTGDHKNGKSRRIGFTEENDFIKSYEIVKELEYAHTIDNKFTRDLLKKIGFRNNVLVTQEQEKLTHLKTSESETAYEDDKETENPHKISLNNEYEKKMIKNLFMNKDKISKVLDKFKENKYLSTKGELKKKLYNKDDNKNNKEEIKCKKRESFIYRTFKDHP